MTRDILPIEAALKDPRCPWDNARQIYNLKQRIAPVRDSKGNIVSPGDPELLSCFVRLVNKGSGPLLIDLARLQRIMDKRRLGEAV